MLAIATNIIAITNALTLAAHRVQTGFRLVFGTWPVILNSLPGGVRWVRLLWFNLYFLGIDSAFSAVEGILIVLRDTALFRGVTNWKLPRGLCMSCFLLSLPMCTDAGFELPVPRSL